MNKFEIEIDFEKVNLSELETEEDFRTEAKKIYLLHFLNLVKP
ncbi:hypothetical protein RintRC_0920 [Richelia intracellularis]|nr:hypothetical protein RintRC_0920 [Richelia intracellularis]